MPATSVRWRISRFNRSCVISSLRTAAPASQVEQRVPDLHGHRLRAAQEYLVDAVQIDHRRRQLPHLSRGDPAVEQVDVLAFPAEQVQHLQPLQIAVLQVVELLPEDDAGDPAVAVDQGERAARLPGQHAAQNGHHQRDAAAGGDRQVVPGVLCVRAHGKATGRRHHLHLVANPQPGVGPAGKPAGRARA